MKVAALFSGGKDSTYAIHYAQQQGFDVTALATIIPKNKESYMFHSLNIGLTKVQAEAMGLRIYQGGSKGVKEEELEDLFLLLEEIKQKERIRGVVCGAIASEYQKTRVERICENLGLASITPLWHIDPETYMRALIDEGFDARIVGVFADGLDGTWLGKKIDEVTLQKLKRLKINIAGEGGEYESFVCDGPNFARRIHITGSKERGGGMSASVEISKAELRGR